MGLDCISPDVGITAVVPQSIARAGRAARCVCPMDGLDQREKMAKKILPMEPRPRWFIYSRLHMQSLSLWLLDFLQMKNLYFI